MKLSIEIGTTYTIVLVKEIVIVHAFEKSKRLFNIFFVI